MGASASVDIWWSKADAVAEASDAPIHCRVTGLGAGLPAGWRRGARRRFVAGVLAHYKTAPAIAAPSANAWRLNGGQGFHLSLSDSGEFLAAAIGRGVPVGVDMEQVRPVDDPLTTLARLGLDALADRLRPSSPAVRNRAFLMLWTAFEAYLKLERLAWDEGAARFSKLAGHWRIDRSGSAIFAGTARAGLAFQHFWPAKELVLAMATPVACPATVHGSSAIEQRLS